jgi:hypothetical protein
MKGFSYSLARNRSRTGWSCNADSTTSGQRRRAYEQSMHDAFAPRKMAEILGVRREVGGVNALTTSTSPPALAVHASLAQFNQLAHAVVPR